eukprot:Nk52_evm115s226 gene=Nk52_evmTU115s226
MKGGFVAAIVVVLLTAFVANVSADEYAVLVAGSKTWSNYRHQADVCHAYQLLVAKGFNPNNIIVMMFDDIAHNPANPIPGKVRNHPDGPDVYEGVKIDYRDKDVTPAVFENVLLGNKDKLKGVGSGRVLESGPEDRVFINFVDHGGVGLIAFPTEFYYATSLIKTLKEMHAKKKFAKLVFYLEACESGSMFEHLPSDIPVFATTAANAAQSSYACDFDNTLGTFTGDVYSVVWMKDAESYDSATETLKQEYKHVKKQVTTSEVCEFGDYDFINEPVTDFIGKGVTKTRLGFAPDLDNAVESRNVPIYMLEHKIKTTRNPIIRFKYQKDLESLYKERDEIHQQFATIAKEVARSHKYWNMIVDRHPLSNLECHEESVKYYVAKCKRTEYSTKMFYIFNNLCHFKHPLVEIHRAIDVAC